MNSDESIRLMLMSNEEIMKEFNIPPVAFNEYHHKFEGEDIVFLYKNKIPPSTANAYGKRFRGKRVGLESLLEKLAHREDHAGGIAYEMLQMKQEIFGRANDVVNRRSDILILLRKLGKFPSHINQYSKRFDAYQILNCVLNGVKAREVNIYDSRITPHSVFELIENNVSAEKADEIIKVHLNQNPSIYQNRKPLTSKEMHNAALSLLKRRRKDFDIRKDNNVQSVKNIRKFMFETDIRFRSKKNTITSNTILKIINENISPEYVQKYEMLNDFEKFEYFFSERYTPEEANGFYSERNTLGLMQLRMLRHLGINYDGYKEYKSQGLSYLLEDIVESKVFFNTLYKTLSLFASGGESFIFNEEDISWKFSYGIDHEYELLELLRKKQKEKSNVVRLLDKPDYAKRSIQEHNLAIKIERIFGETLEKKLLSRKPFLIEKTFSYTKDVINGIIELREVGIYHRDIHDRNILIDEKKDRAVVIDLGVATTDSSEIHSLNRSYGGNNDLISVGQLMYKMATGRNLFNEGPGFTCYSVVKKGVKTKREEVYDDPELLQEYLCKIREDVADSVLADIIVDLLDGDLWVQPELEDVIEAKAMFERYKS